MFSIKVDNTETENQLRLVTNSLKDLSKPFKETGEKVSKEFFGKEVFDSQGGAIGTSWKGHAASTAVARARRWGHYAQAGSPGKILVWTGKLKKGFVYKVGDKQVTITNNVFYFKYNQPERKMMGNSSELERLVLIIFDKYLEEITS